MWETRVLWAKGLRVDTEVRDETQFNLLLRIRAKFLLEEEEEEEEYLSATF